MKGMPVMENQKKIPVLVVEKDQTIVKAIKRALKEKSYNAITVPNEEKSLRFLKEKVYPLAIVGDAEGTDSAIDMMRKIVKTSPMTSIILISDLPKEQVDEKAEGYGILGHISRSIPSKNLTLLIEQFEKISQSIHFSKV
jgi:response regulator RpfG family c-di-GMP phosphodiesterase